jgi:hypothetical protein
MHSEGSRELAPPFRGRLLEYWSVGVLGKKAKSALFDRLNHGVEIRPVAGFEFGMKELSIDADLKSAAARGDERERLNALAEFENFGRQTDGLRRVISNYAVFDRYFGLHFELLSEVKLSMA